MEDMNNTQLQKVHKNSIRKTVLLRTAQTNVASSPDFRNNTIVATTKQYWMGIGPTNKLTAEELSYDKSYHYYGRADTMYHIGEEFGKAMLQLQQKQRMAAKIEDKQRCGTFWCPPNTQN